MQQALTAWAEARGYRVAWGPQRVAREAKRGIQARSGAGELDPELFESELRGLVEQEELPPWATVLMVAVPRPAHRVGFDLEEVGGGHLAAVLPPTYFRYQATFEEVRRDLARNGLPGARVEHLHGPCKAMAAALGLVRYGLNNVTFAERMGSYHQLCGFVTDAELPEPSLPEGPALLAECADCDRCRRACPTEAIAEDRVLLHADRCLTYATETSGAWPPWVRGPKLQCIVGCLVCQRVCPANPSLLLEETGLSFSSRETRALVEQPDALPPDAEDGVAKKLAWLGQPDLRPVLGRNLAALLRGRTPGVRLPVTAKHVDERFWLEGEPE